MQEQRTSTNIPSAGATVEAPATHAESEFKRDMGFWGNLALGFTYLSPVVGVYTTFGLAMGISGPPAFWMLAVAGLGQLLVACVFGEVVSQYPIAGGIYPWNRRLWGAKWGWMSGWIYAVAINATIASVAFGAGPFLGALFDIEMNDQANVMLALAILAFATLTNFGGTKLLANVAFIGFVLEIIATVVIGLWLFIKTSKHDLSVLFTDFRPAEMQEATPFMAAFLASALFGIFLFYGFEANGDVAEEVRDPSRVIPRAMRMTIYIGGISSMFLALGLILSVPDYVAVINGTATDPVGEILVEAFGTGGFKVVIAIVLVSFLSCVISLQAAASRLMYSMGRDQQLPASHLLGKFNRDRAVPPYALLVAAVLPGVFVVISLLSPDALIAILSFASFGIYLAFSSVVIASIRARAKGWKPKGHFSMGAFGWVVSIAAILYQVFAMVVIAQPVAGAENFFQEYIVLCVSAIVVLIGVAYLFVSKPYLRGSGIAEDARTGVVDLRYAEPIAQSEEIVDLAVRMGGGKPNLYPHQDRDQDQGRMH